MWHNPAFLATKFLQREAKVPTMECEICTLTKPVGVFPASAVRNLSKRNQRNMRYYDCPHPPCMFFPKCTPCTKCRRHTCRGGRGCPNVIKTLPSTELPKSKKDVESFACKRCAYVRCNVRQSDGTLCGRWRRQNAQAKAKRDNEPYKCGECQTWMASQETLHASTMMFK